MTLDELCSAVTEAIGRAERLEDDGQADEAGIAYREVSRIEELIAGMLPASSLEGAVARQGVVTAAIRAGDLARARERARAYAGEGGLPENRRAALEALGTRL